MLLTWRDGWRGAQELLDLIGHFDAHLPGQLPLFPIPERAMCSVVMGGYTSCAAPTNTTDLAVLGRDRSGSRPGDRRLRALGTVLGDSANGTEVDDGWLTIGCGCLVAALLLGAYVRRKAGVALRVALVLAALLVTRVTIADIYDVNTTAAGVFPAGATSVSWGLVLAAAGAVAALAIGVGALIGRPYRCSRRSPPTLTAARLR
jgi:hypothetical protein